MPDTEIIRLTDAVNNQAAFAIYTEPVDSSKGLSITFDFFSYSGTGGDGIGFFLLDSNTTLTGAGGFGGSLGYAPRTDTGTPGIQGGYLGVGFDEFGNFSNPTEGRIGGIGRVPNSVAVRSSAATGYKYLAGTTPGQLPPLSKPGAGSTPALARETAKIDLTAAGLLSVSVDLNKDGDFLDVGETLINSYDVINTGQNGALPATFKFGFAGSTGGSNNIHEIANFKATTSDGTPISGKFSSKDVVIIKPVNDPPNPDKPPVPVEVVGGNSKDVFLFSGANKASALKTSLVGSLDKITNFKQTEGDRFQLDFDRNISTIERPRGLFNAGKIKARNITEATKFAYADKNQKRKGKQSLKADEAIFFKFGSKSYLSVNDGKAPFAPKADLVADVTGIQFKAGDAKKGGLAVGNYFV